MFSIGQEISQNTAVAVAWSSAGLAKHRRCALAVLTSNLVLSIWGSESRPRAPHSWKRAVVVNNELERYFDALNGSEKDQSEAGRAKTEERRRRIRSFAWSPATLPIFSASKPQSCAGWGEHFLAVSNDNNEVILLHVQAPYDLLLAHRTKWTIRAVHHFPAPSSHHGSPARTFDDFVQQQRFVGHLAWSPWWIAEGGDLEAVLAYTTNAKLIFTRLRVSHPFPSSSLEITSGKTSAYALKTQLSAPLRWAPKTDGGHIQIIAFSMDGITSFSLPLAAELHMVTSKHDLVGKWDNVVGK